MRPFCIHVCLVVLLIPCLCPESSAFVPVTEGSDSPTGIAPLYFGPSAFPVPDMLDGRICDSLRLELGGDYYKGSLTSDPDYTWCPTFRVSLPLWSDRATLSVWGEMQDYYKDSPSVRAARRVAEGEYALKGNDAGSVYYSLDMLLVREGRVIPSVSLRAATLSATGDKYEIARHYDAPGYFFDMSAGKSFSLGEGLVRRLRLSATTGFLCWQIDNGTQNDALMYALQAALSGAFYDLSAAWGGYTGREHYGDAPRTFKLRLDFHLGQFSPFAHFQRGLRDYPFTMYGAGLAWSIKCL